MNNSCNNKMVMQGNMRPRGQMPMRNTYNMNMPCNDTNIPQKPCFNKKEICMNVYEL